MPLSLKSFSVLSFDVYGTLIDWENGIYNAALPLLNCVDSGKRWTKEEFLRQYEKFESAQQKKTPGMKYSDVLANVYTQLASHLGVHSTPTFNLPQESQNFASSISHWAPFPDTVEALRALKKRYKLVVLSNVDISSFSHSLELLGGEGTFDAVFTAEEIGSYKPDRRNFEFMLREAERRWGVGREKVGVVAQSLWHDLSTAGALGLGRVWVDRKGAVIGVGEKSEGVRWDWRFETLGGVVEGVEKEGNGKVAVEEG